MSDRRELFGRAAYEVVAAGGLRALTHRSVDEAAQLPPGSVNYYAPTRAKLHQLALNEAYVRMRALATREFAPILATPSPPESLILDCTVSFIQAMTTEGRGLVVNRQALLVEAQFDDELHEVVVRNRGEFVAFTDEIALASRPDRPERAAELIVALIEGLVQQQTLVTKEPFPDSMIRMAIARIYGFDPN